MVSRIRFTPETPFVIVAVLAAGEFSWAIFLAVKEAHWFALYLAVKYTLSEKYSVLHYLMEKAKRTCWKHIPGSQCIPGEQR